jgi:RHS repeat-associated protein
VTQIGNGFSTTTYAYDNNGNPTSAGNGTAITTYTYDYANRLTALVSLGATTTYGYDAFGARVYQIVATTSTSTYAFRFFSIASTTKSSTNYSTSTEYVFNGDTLLSTVDQAFKNGTATGTVATRYVHPDHLGSTSTNEKRKFIGKFADDSGLSYLNARYYEGSRGQFLSEDPTFLAVGNPNQIQQLTQLDQNKFLADPQQLNSYSYARGNPISNRDPNGLWALKLGVQGTIPGWALNHEVRFEREVRAGLRRQHVRRTARLRQARD